MTKNERIEKIEMTLLIMEYKEHWTNEDWTKRAALNRELEELRAN